MRNRHIIFLDKQYEEEMTFGIRISKELNNIKRDLLCKLAG
jgi:hypothetical protein